MYGELNDGFRNFPLYLDDVLRTSQVAPVIPVGTEREDRLILRGQTQVCRNDREDTVLVQERKNAWREDMNPGEGKSNRFTYGTNKFGFAGKAGSTATELVIFVEKKIARCWAVLNGEGSERIVFQMELNHLVEVDRADYVDVVD